MNHTLSRWLKSLAMALACGLALFPQQARSVVLALEEFNSDPFWLDRDSGEMEVSYSGMEGNPAGSIGGTFSAQGTPSFESDAFRLDGTSSGGQFVGDYSVKYPGGYTDFTFDFLPKDETPSTFIFRINSGGLTFIYNMLPQVGMAGVWTTGINVPLDYSSGWLGGSAAQFVGALEAIDSIDIQIGRNGTSEQRYYVDNFALLNEPDDGPPGGGGTVPEPGTMSLVLVGAVMIGYVRKRWR